MDVMATEKRRKQTWLKKF